MLTCRWIVTDIACIYNILLSWHRIKLMISLKLDHSHPHSNHLPCHPTRSFIQQQNSISETDREQISQNDQNQQPNQGQIYANNNFKTVQSRAKQQFETVQILPVKKVKKPVHHLTPEQIYGTNVIQQAFQASAKTVPTNIRALIMQKQKLIQDKVYLGLSDKGSDLLQRIYEQIDTETHLKDRIQENLLQMMAQIQENLQFDIASGNKYVIHNIIRSTKKDVILNRRRNHIDANGLTSNNMTFNTSKSAGQNVTSKDDSKSYASSQIPSQHPSQQDYSLKSSQTKKAQDFIKKIQKQQIQQRERRKQQQQRKKSLQVRSMQQKRQFEQQIKTQRKNYLKRRIQAKKEIKLKQLQVRQKMNKQYKQFLQKYKNKTPLFKQKQQSFVKQQQQQKRRQQSILQKIKQNKRSIDLSQLKQHEKRYKQLKIQKQKQKQNQKINQMKLKLASSSYSPDKNYYKSKHHEILAEEEQKQKQRQIREDPKLIRSQLIKKRDLYSKSVRQNYMPKGDEAKQKQLKQIIEKLQWTDKLKNGKLEPKQRNEAGNQYLKRLHQLIAQLRQKNKLPSISKTIDYQELLQQSKPRYKNYLQEMKISRRYSIDHDYDSQKLSDIGLEQAHFRAQRYEANAKRREVIMNLNGKQLNIDQALLQQKKIDDHYLEAVRVKMALLNKYD